MVRNENDQMMLVEDWRVLARKEKMKATHVINTFENWSVDILVSVFFGEILSMRNENDQMMLVGESLQGKRR